MNIFNTETTLFTKDSNDYRLQPLDSIRAELLSKSMTFLKFPLAVLVVILHCDLSTKPFEKVGISLQELSEPLYANISWLLSRNFAYSAVPCFFIISGFLLFYNIKALNTEIYLKKLKKRCKSLLIPYISWCMIYIFLYWLIGQKNIILSEVPSLFDTSCSPLYFIFNVFVKPLDGPLWFIRNLFFMVVLSPLLYSIIKKTKYLLPVSLLVAFLIYNNSIIGSLLWFSFGVSFAVQKIDFLFFCHKYIWLNLTIVVSFVLLDYIVYPIINVHLTRYFLMFTIMTILGICYSCVKRFPQITNNHIINNSSFTIYAYHALPTLVFIPILWNLAGKTLGSTFVYFFTIFLIVMIGIILSILINKSKILRSILCGR